MKQRRRYTAAQKAVAVGIAAVEGVTEAERRTGIPKESVHYWLRDERFASLRTRARAEVAEDFWAGVQIGLEEVSKGLQDPRVPLRDKAQALDVLFRSQGLMTGQATERIESKDITADLSDHEREALRKAIDDAVAV